MLTNFRRFFDFKCFCAVLLLWFLLIFLTCNIKGDCLKCVAHILSITGNHSFYKTELNFSEQFANDSL